jgi:hypothetical protein
VAKPLLVPSSNVDRKNCKLGRVASLSRVETALTIGKKTYNNIFIPGQR